MLEHTSISLINLRTVIYSYLLLIRSLFLTVFVDLEETSNLNVLVSNLKSENKTAEIQELK